MRGNYSKNISELRLLLEYSWQKYHIQHSFFESLDSKISRLATFIGILFTIIIGFVYNIITPAYFESIVNCNLPSQISFAFLILLVISISVTFYYSLSSLTVRKIIDPTKISTIREYFKSIEKIDKQSQRKLIIYMINSLSKSEENVRAINLYKSEKVKLVSFWLRITFSFALLNVIMFAILKLLNN